MLGWYIYDSISIWAVELKDMKPCYLLFAVNLRGLMGIVVVDVESEVEAAGPVKACRLHKYKIDILPSLSIPLLNYLHRDGW